MESVEVDDRFVRALIGIRNVLGPDFAGCSDGCCEGCRAEMWEALRLASEALGFSGPKERP